MNKGNFIISLDFELLWGLAGWDCNSIAAYSPRIKNSVTSVEKIINLFNRYNLKCTIAVVGAMACNGKSDYLSKIGNKYPDYKNKEFSSYESILPLMEKYPKEFFYIPHFIELLNNNSAVELASHTFSHFYCLEEGSKPEDFEADLIAMKSLYPSLKTIIFPRNQVNSDYLQLCQKYGFTHYRGKLDHALYLPQKTTNRYSLKGAMRFLDTYLPISGNQTFKTTQCTHSNLKNIPESCFLRPYSSKLSFLDGMKLRRIKSGMTYAAKHGRSFHIWWHPHNFGLKLSENLMFLEKICEHYKILSSKYGYQSKFISDL